MTDNTITLPLARVRPRSDNFTNVGPPGTVLDMADARDKRTSDIEKLLAHFDERFDKLEQRFERLGDALCGPGTVEERLQNAGAACRGNRAGKALAGIVAAQTAKIQNDTD